MIFELAQDFRDAVAAMPREHAKHHMLGLIEEAIRRDIHFIDRHPTTLFQCMWNTCWWYDNPNISEYYDEWPDFNEEAKPVLKGYMENWRAENRRFGIGHDWLRSISPAQSHLRQSTGCVLKTGQDPINEMSVCEQGELLAVRTQKKISLWNMKTQQRLHEREIQPGWTRGLMRIGSSWTCSLKLTNNHLIVAYVDGKTKLLLLDPVSFHILRHDTVEEEAVPALTISEDGELLYCGRSDGSIGIINIQSGRVLSCWNTNLKTISCLSCSRDGKKIAVACGCCLQVWRLDSTPTLEFDLSGKWDGFDQVMYEGQANSIGLDGFEFSPDGQLLLSRGSGMMRGEVKVWNLSDGSLKNTINYGKNSPQKLRYYSCEASFVAISFRGDVRCWKSEVDMLPTDLPSPQAKARTLAPWNESMLVGYSSGEIWSWPMVFESGLRLKGHWADITYVAISSDGHYAATGGRDCLVCLWDLSNGILMHSLKGHLIDIWKLEFNDAGTKLASFADGVKVWDIQTGEVEASSKNLVFPEADEWRTKGFYYAVYENKPSSLRTGLQHVDIARSIAWSNHILKIFDLGSAEIALANTGSVTTVNFLVLGKN